MHLLLLDGGAGEHTRLPKVGASLLVEGCLPGVRDARGGDKRTRERSRVVMPSSSQSAPRGPPQCASDGNTERNRCGGNMSCYVRWPTLKALNVSVIRLSLRGNQTHFRVRSDSKMLGKRHHVPSDAASRAINAACRMEPWRGIPLPCAQSKESLIEVLFSPRPFQIAPKLLRPLVGQ